MNHLSWDDVWEYLDGELLDSDTVKAHLDACAECTRNLQRARTAQNAIMDAFRLPESMKEVPQSSDGLLQRLQTIDANPKHRGFRRRTNWGVWTAAVSGAAAAIVIGTIVGIRTFSPTESALEGHHNSMASVQPNNGVVTNKAMSKQGTSQQGIASSSDTATATNSTQGPKVMNQLEMTVPDIQSTFDVQVKTAAGSAASQAVSGARVIVLANGNVVTDLVTGQDGVTKKVDIHVPVDPVLSPSFHMPGATPRGSATVVVTKLGYQPFVQYDTWVFSGQPTTLDVTLKPANQPGPSVTDNGFHLLEVGQYAQWAQQQEQSGTAVQSPQPGVPVGHVKVDVVDQDGHPVSNAKVVVVNGDVITAVGTTSDNGATQPLPSTGMRDLRAAYPGQNLSEVPNTVNLVVVKDGYAVGVDFYQPLTIGQTVTLGAKLQSLAWRKANDYNNLDAPSWFGGSGSPSAQQTAALVQWITTQKAH